MLCYNCCRKTAVCIGDQLLDFSVPELIQSQSTFSTDPEVLQICTGFTLCSSAGLAVGDCSAVMGLTSCMLCVQIYCVLCVLDYYLLNSQLWIQDWVRLCFGNLCVFWVLLTSGYHKLSANKDYLKFQPKSSMFSKKTNKKEALSELPIASFVSSKPRQHSIVFHNVPVILVIYVMYIQDTITMPMVKEYM